MRVKLELEAKLAEMKRQRDELDGEIRFLEAALRAASLGVVKTDRETLDSILRSGGAS